MDDNYFYEPCSFYMSQWLKVDYLKHTISNKVTDMQIYIKPPAFVLGGKWSNITYSIDETSFLYDCIYRKINEYEKTKLMKEKL